MKNWIKVGSCHLNLDYIASVHELDSDGGPTRIKITSTAAAVPPIILDGDEADAVLKHVCDGCCDLTPKKVESVKPVEPVEPVAKPEAV